MKSNERNSVFQCGKCRAKECDLERKMAERGKKRRKGNGKWSLAEMSNHNRNRPSRKTNLGPSANMAQLHFYQSFTSNFPFLSLSLSPGLMLQALVQRPSLIVLLTTFLVRRLTSNLSPVPACYGSRNIRPLDVFWCVLASCAMSLVDKTRQGNPHLSWHFLKTAEISANSHSSVGANFMGGFAVMALGTMQNNCVWPVSSGIRKEHFNIFRFLSFKQVTHLLRIDFSPLIQFCGKSFVSRLQCKRFAFLLLLLLWLLLWLFLWLFLLLSSFWHC